MEDIRDLLHADPVAAIAQIETGTPENITDRYEAHLLDLYWKQKDLSAVCVLYRAGVRFALTASESTAPGLRQKLRNAARRLSYNTGSFTWPGWEEPGINPSTADLATGRDCAALNLQLAMELEVPIIAVSKAHWLIGAHALAARDAITALHHFQLAHTILPPADPAVKVLESLNLGNIALAQLALDPSNAFFAGSFDSIITTLQSRADEESRDFLQQLQSSRRLFVP